MLIVFSLGDNLYSMKMLTFNSSFVVMNWVVHSYFFKILFLSLACSLFYFIFLIICTFCIQDSTSKCVITQTLALSLTWHCFITLKSHIKMSKRKKNE
jgi:hypothetical protein